MKLNHFAYIYLGPQLNPAKHRAVIDADGYKLTVVGVAFDKKADVVNVAKQLVEEGVQAIELCGGLGPIWLTKIHEAIGAKVPVGSVAYGPESRKPMLDLVS